MEFPPRYVVADEVPVSMKVDVKDGKEITVNAIYTWEQDSWNILQVFHFFPSKRQLMVYNKEQDLKWTLKEEYKDKISPTMPIQFNIPMWKYWLATISILLIVLLLVIVSQIQSFFENLSAYNRAKKNDTFNSYKDFLILYNAPDFLRKKAKQRLKNKIGTYKKFLQVVTLKTSGELKEVIFKIIDSIGDSGNVDVNVQFEPDIKVLPQSKFLMQNVKMFEELPKPNQKTFSKWREILLRDSNLTWSSQELGLLFTKTPDIEKAIKMVELKKNGLKLESEYNYADVTKFFTKGLTNDRQQLFVHYLNNLFEGIFPERIIKLKKDCDSSITFHVKSIFRNKNSYRWWEKDKVYALTKRPLLPDVECSWEFYISIKDVKTLKTTFVSNTISSTTDYPLYHGKQDLEKVYMFGFTSAFAKFGEEIAEAFGMYQRSSLSKTKSPLSPIEVYTSFEDTFNDYLFEQAGDLPEALIEEFFGEYESSLEGLLISAEYTEQLIMGVQSAISEGLEIGSFLGDVILGALSSEDS